jgi:hypothetical protein
MDCFETIILGYKINYMCGIGPTLNSNFWVDVLEEVFFGSRLW